MKKSLKFAILIFLNFLVILSILFFKQPNQYLSAQNKEKKPQQTDNFKKDSANQLQNQIVQDQNLKVSNANDEQQANNPGQESSDKFSQASEEIAEEPSFQVETPSLPVTSIEPKSSPSLIQEECVTLEIAQLGLFKVDLQDYDTALTILKKGGTENSFEVEYQWYEGLGAFISCINGICNKDNNYWFFYYNGKYSNVGASSQPVKAGDITSWKFERK